MMKAMQVSGAVDVLTHCFSREGYTIGYYGRIFKAKNGVKGGAFDADTEFERFVIGSGTVVPGLEEGILGMTVGGVRQIVVPPELRYRTSFWPYSIQSHASTTQKGSIATFLSTCKCVTEL